MGKPRPKGKMKNKKTGYEGDGGIKEDASELAQVAVFAAKQMVIEDEIASIEETLIEANRRLKVVKEGELPAALKEAGLSKVTLADGSEIDCSKKYYASITVEKSKKCISWLRKNKLKSIIKNKVSLKFPRGNSIEVRKWCAGIKKVVNGIEISNREEVNSKTLVKTITEILEGDSKLATGFPKELFGVYHQQIAKIKRVTPDTL